MRHLVIAQWHFSLPKNGFMNERNEKQAVPGWGNEDVYTRSSRQNCDPWAGHKCEGQNTPLTMDWCKHINSVCRNAGLAFWVCETLWDYIYIYVCILNLLGLRSKNCHRDCGMYCMLHVRAHALFLWICKNSGNCVFCCQQQGLQSYMVQQWVLV